jgi:ABC-type multidrug transport system ATPase subunit
MSARGAGGGELAVEVRDLVKSFGPVPALAGASLTVRAGTLAALLGPNGAGKTTLVRILATLIRADSGEARVLGRDVAAQPYAVRSLIGLTGQYAGLDEALSGRENMVLIGRLSGQGRRAARLRAAELVERFGLAAAASRAVSSYSGGMRRRLDLAASLMSRPALLILDEPSTGVDPAGRLELWAALAELRAGGTSMLLTTQYLEEADNFADVVHVLDHGRVVATGTAAELRARTGAQVVEIRLAAPAATGEAALALGGIAMSGAELQTDPAAGRITLLAADGLGTLLSAAQALSSRAIPVADIALRRPSLDEAFLALTATAGPGSLTGTGAGAPRGGPS